MTLFPSGLILGALTAVISLRSLIFTLRLSAIIIKE
jgi:hypothetical protein